MVTFISVEFLKNKRRKFIFPLILITSLTALWFYMSMMRVTLSTSSSFKIDQNYLLMNLMMVNGVFTPLFLSVLASQISNIEFNNRMWLVLSVNNQSRQQLLNAKIIYGSLLIFIYWIMQVLVAIAVGHLVHITFYGHLFLITMIALGLALVVMFLFQLVLSFFIKRQAIGLIVGIIGSFIALMTSGLLPDFVLRWLPVDYVALSSPLKLVNGMQIIINQNFLFNFMFIFSIGASLFAFAQILARKRGNE
ncbi:ABC transporter permease [Leuconostoc miyukkimchii]|uniref:ABC transporter permease n=1 Tax=Leuconostoc miyukkimchii TaxID=910540 RepID=UPI001C7CA116|nr:ABC transporter permease [Leuconostoc miyukkimchii]